MFGQRSSTVFLRTTMSTWVTLVDLSSHHSPIDATEHFAVQFIFIMEELQKVQLVLVKLRQSKISQRHLQDSVLCLTALMVSITKPWVSSSKVLHAVVPGVVSMSSTVSNLKCSLSLLNRYNPFSITLIREMTDSSLKDLKFL